MDFSKRTISAVLAMTMVFSFLPKVTGSATEEDIFTEPTMAETQEWTEPTEATIFPSETEALIENESTTETEAQEATEARMETEASVLPTELTLDTTSIGETVYAEDGEKDFSEYPEIVLDEPTLVTIENEGEKVYYRFIPNDTEFYHVYTTDDVATQGCMYENCDGELKWLDDYYNNRPFTIKLELTAGKEYILETGFHLSSNTGSYHVMIEVDHKMESFVEREPTCTQDGIKKYSCKYCDYSYTESIPARHNNENGDYLCTLCGASVCGDNLTWTFDDVTKTLTISGQGKMYDFNPDNRPWETVREQVGRILLEDGTASIAGNAFKNCTNLTEIQIPNTVMEIGYSAFENCTSLPEVHLPAKLEELGEWVFQNCTSLPAIEIPGTITRISYHAFSDCTALTSVDLPDNLKRINSFAFSNCTSLSDVDFPQDLEEIYDHAFSNCSSLKEIDIPNGVFELGIESFEDCVNLATIKLPSSLFQIDPGTFQNCVSLKEILLPEGLSSIFEGAFFNCSNLQIIKFLGDAPSFIVGDYYDDENWDYLTGEDSFFKGVTADVYYPANNPTWTKDVRKDYGGKLTWIAYNSDAATSGICGENLTWNYDKQTQTLTISGQGRMDYFNPDDRPWEAFHEQIEQIIVEDGTSYISGNAFINCTSLAEIEMPNTVMEIGYSAFENCTSLVRVKLPNKLEEIGEWTFRNCSSLPAIEISGTVSSIPLYAFSDCIALSSVKLPESLTGIASYAFSNCPSLTEIDIPDGVTELSTECFENCTNLTTVKLPAKLDRIRGGCFQNCTSLKEIMLPKELSCLDEGVFSNCTSLTRIHFSGDAPNFNIEDFYDEYDWDHPTGEDSFFKGVVADAYYPTSNSTWTEDVQKDYGGTLTWIPYNMEGETSGTCGENVVWQLSEDGQLTISGTSTAEAVTYGARSTSNCRMDDYASAADTPWYSLREQIKTVLIEGNVDYVGGNAFSGCPNLTSVSIEDGVGEIHSTAFSDSPALETVYYGGSEEAWNEMDVDTGDAQVHYNGSTATAHTETKRTVAPTCTEKGYDLYECSCGSSRRENETDALGHDLGDPVFDAETKTHTRSCSRCDHSETEDCIFDEGTVTKEPTEDTPGEKEFTCTVCDGSYTEEIPAEGHEHSYTPVITEPSCTQQGYTTYTCSCGDTYIDDYVDPTGHNYENGVCTVCQDRAVKRISGQTRIETALEVAKTLKEVLGVEKFNTIIIANGEDTRFADALTGSYLANVKGAPILMYTQNANEALTAATMAFIQENLSRDGMIYLLGGEATLPENVKASLADYKVERLSGETRFDTNLRILEEAGVGGNQEILIAKGYNFADSLSASATGLPILVVNDVSGKLTEEQIAFLEAHKENPMTILGGTSSISEDLEAQIEEIVGKNMDRVYGMRRENTSVAIAERYFPNADFALVTYSQGSADGLCGGPLAYAKNAPLLLTASGMESVTNAYIASHDITSGYILGGTATISEDTAEAVFGTAETK